MRKTSSFEKEMTGDSGVVGTTVLTPIVDEATMVLVELVVLEVSAVVDEVVVGEESVVLLV